MKTLQSEWIRLRAMEPEDLEALYRMENDPEVWTISYTQAPYSKYMLKKFIDASVEDIYTAKQLRLMMDEKESSKTAGIVDLFDFEPLHRRVGIGILVDKEYRQKGYAGEAIRLVKEYAFDVLNMHQVYCNILENNKISLSLFQKEGFEIAGCKKDWILTDEGYKDELMLQCLKK